ncbi:cytochrome c biogenesis CcdA family protein [Microbacterium invictum]|nr:cytochrome c biogenesis protein CcdA [Microbacterium invictum]
MLAGLVSFLSPCVLPLVPGYLGFLGGATAGRPRRDDTSDAHVGDAEVRRIASHSHDSGDYVRTSRDPAESATTTRAAGRGDATGRGRLLLGVVLFIAGFTLVFVAMGVFAGTIGRVFLQYQDPITRVLGVVIIAMGLVFIGVFGFAQRTFRPQLRENVGLIGAPLLGIAMGLGWAPCIGPTLAAILSMGYSQADPGRAGLLAAAYSIGLGLPFVLLAVGFGWATKSVAVLRRHIRAINIIGGALLIILGVLMVTGVWTATMSQLMGVMNSVELPI